MSLVTIQLGQCGNQIGQQLFSDLSSNLNSKNYGVSLNENEDFKEELRDRFFIRGLKNKLHARAVLIDMESKVVDQVNTTAGKSGKFSYQSANAFSEKSGSGNNWAFGFGNHSYKVQQFISNTIRKEVEKCDYFSGFLCMHSLAGGTGSGVGSFITKELRDNYSNSFIINNMIWPYTSGEVTVQNYNAILTLSHIYNITDAVMVLENDDLHQICLKSLNLKKVAFSDINRVASQKLAGVFLPSFTNTGHSSTLGDMIEHLTSHPEYRLVTIRDVPHISEKALSFSTYQWPYLLKRLRQMVIANAPIEEGVDWNISVGENVDGPPKFNRSLSNLLILRGKDSSSTNTSLFQDDKLYTSWMPSPMMFSKWVQPRIINPHEKSAFLASNGMSLVVPLNHVVSRAWSMFSSRAFLHHYYKYGLTEDDFMNSFIALEQIIQSYGSL